ncbi:MAG: GntR family transcriptional regulator [Sedimentibacter sp.]
MKHLGLKDKAYELIKERLLSGKIKPGERIREDLLAEEISMSRTPVREAINQLSAEGFVCQVARKGIFATEISREELKDIIEIRVLLETYAAKVCCSKITESQINELEDIFNKLKNALLNQDKEKYGMFDGLFHKKIGKFTGNKKLSTVINDIEDSVIFCRRMDVYNIRHKYTEEDSIKQHEDILLAIKNRNEEDAFNMMEKNTKELFNRMMYE